ncbi:DUF3656 domain-containing U32 family peptidase [Desulfolucanica intricata]|uniref:DUF3656 domain-containing U32 family peptidase n=1 Tax=Desulfolucanica intricata TaxID=1285191 RepID=UPI000836C31A|nr:DUF3656 domain-containing protein [Desulfolucanica intricata]
MYKPELLAPAGDWEAFVAAVENGADAVYLGGKMFSARSSAVNFDNKTLARAVEYAHIRDVKVFVTVNTLLADHELAEAAEFLFFLNNIGVDAVIVQDLGLARLARKVVPELPLHASTQMTVHSLPAVELLMDAGFERIVLAREMSLQAINNIKKKTGAELEVFIHGALCVCYSGQCLMSSMIGGRSGNRGRCAQPCRMRYELIDESGRKLVDPSQVGEYLLSPRDLNLSAHIPELIRAGIDSFKIEGRMKRPEYVATVIRVYRNLIDRVLKGEDFLVTKQEARDLTQIFNRDFTTGYFFGRPGRDLMSYKRPNNRGIRLGRVKHYDSKKKTAKLALEESLRVGDGVEFWVTEGGRVGTEINSIIQNGKNVERAEAGSEVLITVPRRVRPGDRVFKTHDADLIEMARASFTSPKEQTKIPLTFYVRAREGEPLYLKAVEPSGRTAEAKTMAVGQKAEKRPLDSKYLEKQLGRLGNSPFGLAELNLDLSGELIYPVREINEARRQVIEKLERERIREGRNVPIAENVYRDRLSAAMTWEGQHPVKNREPGLSVTVTDLKSLQEAVRAGANLVYFGGESFRSKKNFTAQDIYSGLDFCKANNVSFVFSSPRILQDNELSRFAKLLELVSSWQIDGVQVGNLGLLKLVQNITDKPIYSDFPLNVFNYQAAVFLLEHNVRQITLSPELTLKQIRKLTSGLIFNAEVLVHGAVPLMVSEYCAIGSLLGGFDSKNKCAGPCSGKHCGLKDRMGVVFPVEVDQYCHMHIFNSKDLCVLEDVPELSKMGISSFRIEARHEDFNYVRKVATIYREALDSVGVGSDKDLQKVKEVLTELVPGGLTKGHYYRGVIEG